MWKPNQPGSPNPSTPSPEPARPAAAPMSSSVEPMQPRPSQASVNNAPTEQATIGKSLIVKGEVAGSESLYIDGRVEGSINLPGNRVTVGRNGQISANVTAREVVVLGKVRGNINASDRVDIRSEGSLTGDVIAQRISIEDGAFFKGGIDIRKPGATETAKTAAASSGNSQEKTPAAAVPAASSAPAANNAPVQGALRV